MKLFLIIWFLSLLACSSNLKNVREEEPTTQFIEEYRVNPKTGLKEGLSITYDSQGKITAEAEYKKGKLHGERKIFNDTGQLIILEHYRADVFHGGYETYYEGGQVELKGGYKDGAMTGDWKRYYPSGQLMEVVRFENNEENGPFKEYYENGNLKAEGTYLNGDNEHGELLLYDEQGKLIQKMMCNEGVCKTTWKADENK